MPDSEKIAHNITILAHAALDSEGKNQLLHDKEIFNEIIAGMKAQWKILDEHKRGYFSLAKNIKKKLYERRLSQTNQLRQKLRIFLKEAVSYR